MKERTVWNSREMRQHHFDCHKVGDKKTSTSWITIQDESSQAVWNSTEMRLAASFQHNFDCHKVGDKKHQLLGATVQDESSPDRLEQHANN